LRWIRLALVRASPPNGSIHPTVSVSHRRRTGERSAAFALETDHAIEVYARAIDKKYGAVLLNPANLAM
jgi:hypothetical protein